MNKNVLKLKKGGLDTIIAYIVVILPLIYVLIYMVATIYHYSVQMYMNQVVKEATVMISTYGAITSLHEDYIKGKLSKVLDKDENGNVCTIRYSVRKFNDDTGIVADTPNLYDSVPPVTAVSKADIIGISVQSVKPSLLSTVATFSVFGQDKTSSDLYYSSYREEIIRNERNQ